MNQAETASLNQAEIAIEASEKFDRLMEGRTRYNQSGIDITAHVIAFKSARLPESYFPVTSSKGMVFSQRGSLAKHLKRI